MHALAAQALPAAAARDQPCPGKRTDLIIAVDVVAAAEAVVAAVAAAEEAAAQAATQAGGGGGRVGRRGGAAGLPRVDPQGLESRVISSNLPFMPKSVWDFCSHQTSSVLTADVFHLNLNINVRW